MAVEYKRVILLVIALPWERDASDVALSAIYLRLVSRVMLL